MKIWIRGSSFAEKSWTPELLPAKPDALGRIAAHEQLMNRRGIPTSGATSQQCETFPEFCWLLNLPSIIIKLLIKYFIIIKSKKYSGWSSSIYQCSFHYFLSFDDLWNSLSLINKLNSNILWSLPLFFLLFFGRRWHYLDFRFYRLCFPDYFWTLLQILNSS